MTFVISWTHHRSSAPEVMANEITKLVSECRDLQCLAAAEGKLVSAQRLLKENTSEQFAQILDPHIQQLLHSTSSDSLPLGIPYCIS